MKNKYNFIYISQLNFGGAERVVIDYLNNSKDNFILITDKKNSQLINEIKKSIKILHLDVKLPLLFRLLNLLIFIVKLSPDKIISHLTHCNIHILILKKFFNIKSRIFCYEHNTFSKDVNINTFRGSVIKFCAKRFYHLSSKIIVVSEKVKIDLINSIKLNPNKIQVIYNPIDYKIINDKSKKSTDFKFNNKFKYLIFVGRLEDQKDPLRLIQIFSLLSKDYPSQYKLLIFGDGTLKNKILLLIKNLNLIDDIFLFGFNINPYSYMRKSDILIFPSKYEGFGLVLIEALFLNLKVVCSDIDTTKELLKLTSNTFFAKNNLEFIEMIIKAKNFKFKRIRKDFFNQFSINNYVNILNNVIN